MATKRACYYDAQVLERFGSAGVVAEQISMAKDTFTFSSPQIIPTEFIDLFHKYYGPTMNAFEAAEKNGSTGIWIHRLSLRRFVRQI